MEVKLEIAKRNGSCCKGATAQLCSRAGRFGVHRGIEGEVGRFFEVNGLASAAPAFAERKAQWKLSQRRNSSIVQWGGPISRAAWDRRRGGVFF